MTKLNGWTEERKKRQSENIYTWKPWKYATGPRTPEGKARISKNAWKHAGYTKEEIKDAKESQIRVRELFKSMLKRNQETQHAIP